jgi:hypothetical protein
MTERAPPPPLVIGRIRITGLAGAAPHAAAVRAAITRALANEAAAPPAPRLSPASAPRATVPAGATLHEAAGAAARLVRRGGR